MNGGIEHELERVDGKIIARVRMPHQSSMRPMVWPNGDVKRYDTPRLALDDIYLMALGMLSGGNKIRGTANGIAKRHTVDSVFGKGA